MTVSLDLVKVTSAFLSKALTHFSPAVTTATNFSSFAADYITWRGWRKCWGLSLAGIRDWWPVGHGEGREHQPRGGLRAPPAFHSGVCVSALGAGWVAATAPPARQREQPGPREGHGAVPPGPSGGGSAATEGSPGGGAPRQSQTLPQLQQSAGLRGASCDPSDPVLCVPRVT